uniref:Uncharacterized protein n=1 Tax=Oryctolagus cuniculus TaxID=9986 RepID=A0A5F9CVV4_RABIT
MTVLHWQHLRTWWWSPSSTTWESWASSALETSTPLETGATWTKWPRYAGSSRISPTLEATLAGSPFSACLRVAQVCHPMCCRPCPKVSSTEPSWRVGWPCCPASSPARLRWSPQWWPTCLAVTRWTLRPWCTLRAKSEEEMLAITTVWPRALG